MSFRLARVGALSARRDNVLTGRAGCALGVQFLAYLNERGNDGSIVIILTHARINDIVFTDLGAD